MARKSVVLLQMFLYPSTFSFALIINTLLKRFLFGLQKVLALFLFQENFDTARANEENCLCNSIPVKRNVVKNFFHFKFNSSIILCIFVT